MNVDLNADVGESFGAYRIGNDEDLFPLISSANIACGLHAGDPRVMCQTVSLAKQYGVSPGAHPGYPDIQGFGRRSMSLGESDVYAFLLYQIGALRAFTSAAGLDLRHVKPHGALYNDAAKNSLLARGVARAIKDAGGELWLVGLPNCEMEKAAGELGIPYVREFFADRAYEDDGSLVARSKMGAVIEDEEACVQRVLNAVKRGSTISINGKEIPVFADTVCLHGDNPKAVAFALRLSDALRNAGICVAASDFGRGQ